VVQFLRLRSGGPLSLSITRTLLTLTLTFGIADLRNSGPVLFLQRNWSLPVLCVGCWQFNSGRLVSNGIIYPPAFYVYLSAWCWNDGLAYVSSMAAIRPQPKEWYHDENDHNLKSTFVKFTRCRVLRLNSRFQNKSDLAGYHLVCFRCWLWKKTFVGWVAQFFTSQMKAPNGAQCIYGSCKNRQLPFLSVPCCCLEIILETMMVIFVTFAPFEGYKRTLAMATTIFLLNKNVVHRNLLVEHVIFVLYQNFEVCGAYVFFFLLTLCNTVWNGVTSSKPSCQVGFWCCFFPKENWYQRYD